MPIPYHAATNFKATPYNSNDEALTQFSFDVSYVKLSWVNPPANNLIPGHPIPKSYTIKRRTANKEKNYELDFSKTNISSTDTSFNDTTYPIGTQVPRIYVYDLSANYD